MELRGIQAGFGIWPICSFNSPISLPFCGQVVLPWKMVKAGGAGAGAFALKVVISLGLFASTACLAQAGVRPGIANDTLATFATSATSSVLREACDRPAFQERLHVHPGTPESARMDARGVWLNRRLIKWPGADGLGVFRLYHAAAGGIVAVPNTKTRGAEGWLALDVFDGALPAELALRFKYVGNGVVLKVRNEDLDRLPTLHKQQGVLVAEDAAGNVIDATLVQSAGAIDDLYAAADRIHDLGVSVSDKTTRFRLWAPTAQQVTLCIFGNGTGPALQVATMRWDAETGSWSYSLAADLSGKYYTYLVDVFVPGTGVIRNRVTDPYSISLTTDSTRSYIANLNSGQLKPRGWDVSRSPVRIKASTDMVIYELHVRDFSINDPTVPLLHRGKYRAFTDSGSNGMKHLKALSAAGMTDVHLLPVFDFATVPESGCVTPDPGRSDSPASETQQTAIMAIKERDCFNWGYDPLHYTAPEGSYTSDAADGARRIIEFREMVLALNGAGLRVGMDVVYNHTSASGQHEKSVLDRIVPGYYHRLNATGVVEKSTCCDNTSTENLMMAKLMADSVSTWARQYKIDSFRFDLMGHQPRAVMEKLKDRLKAETGREIQLIGEGWNFGEVADGARFVQASQLSLMGSGIGTFSDRGRDAVRGGGAADNGEAMIKRQGYINGLGFDPNSLASADGAGAELLRTADLVRVGLAGSIRDYPLKTHADRITPLHRIDYAGQAAGYASEPGEVVNYVENHDNQTLFDINVYKLPVTTSREDRARVQILGLAINAFSQGIAYFHAGGEILRSKSLDRNSYDSGDWFNRLDWNYRDNYFATGAPPQNDNGADYGLIKPLLANPAIKPTAAEIAWTRAAFLDLLRIRSSTTLFRLRTAADITSRLTFHNTGSNQIPTLLVGHLNGDAKMGAEGRNGLYAGARFRELVYLINVDKIPQGVSVSALKGKAFELHPVHLNPLAADRHVKAQARYNAVTGTFNVPARSAVVFVVK